MGTAHTLASRKHADHWGLSVAWRFEAHNASWVKLCQGHADMAGP